MLSEFPQSSEGSNPQIGDGHSKNSPQNVKCITCDKILTPGLKRCKVEAIDETIDKEFIENEQIFQCCWCPYVSESKSNRNRHEKAHHIYKLCKFCSKSVNGRTSMQLHLKKWHNIKMKLND